MYYVYVKLCLCCDVVICLMMFVYRLLCYNCKMFKLRCCDDIENILNNYKSFGCILKWYYL